jgi:subtilisin family serine protease
VRGVDYTVPGVPYGVEPGNSLRPCPAQYDSLGRPLADNGPYKLDCGHGTGVASIAAGTTYGVAKNASIISVKVIPCDPDAPYPCSGKASTIVSGINWVVRNHATPAVMNLSLALRATSTNANEMTALDNAVEGAVASGITTIAAAGNGNGNDGACFYSPARTPNAITVGATTRWDERWVDTYWHVGSNTGPCIDLYAPGAEIPSAYITGPDAERPRFASSGLPAQSGTSFAAAHVTGIVAQYLQVHPTAMPAEVTNWLLTNATPGAIDTTRYSLGNGPNRLAYSYCVLP